jgi:hypothetical protein
VAWSVLGAFAVGMLMLLGVSSRYYLINNIPIPKQPAVLEDRALEVLHTLGFSAIPGDRETGLFYNESYLEHVAENDSSVSRWNVLQQPRPSAMMFWYRQSPEHMRPRERFGNFNVTFSNPPNTTPGMIRMVLDAAGHLEFLHVVPQQVDSASARAGSDSVSVSITETQLFDLAGLDRQGFEPSESVWVPPVYTSERRAWTGSYPGQPDLPVRLETGFLHGQLVHLRTAAPWDEPWKPRSARESALEKAGGFFGTLLTLALLLAGALLARSHVRHGRGDRRGASRLTVFIMVLYMTTWLFTTNHAGSLQVEFNQFTSSFAIMMFIASLFWVLYLALEPYMRRDWPDMIVSWTRLLGGRFRDPLVGRDILAGVVLGVVVSLIDVMEHVVPEWLGVAPRVPERSSPMALYGVPSALVFSTLTLGNMLFQSLAITFLVLGLRRLFRNQWVAVAAVILMFGFLTGAQTSSEDMRLVAALFGMLTIGVMLITLLRFGMLTVVVLGFCTHLLDSAPLTTDFSRWYASSGGLALVILLVLVAYGFTYAVAGKPMQALRSRP